MQSPLYHYETVEQYKEFLVRLKKKHEEILLITNTTERDTALAKEIAFKRLLLRTDLFFMLWYGCNKAYVANDWVLKMCKMVEKEPNGCLDLWAREHLKSTIITYGKSLQDIICSHGDDPLPEWQRETTIGILSVTRPLAKSFLREIKQTLENNALPIVQLFPDIFYTNPKGESPKWSEDDGLIVKRKSSPKESTVEAWGLIDGQPTGKHFFEVIYDDIVTQDSVTSPEMIQKTTERWGLSDNIGTRGGIYRIVGTPYAANDTLQHIQDTGTFKLRKFPATLNGKWPIDRDDEAFLLSKVDLEKKHAKQGAYNFSCQMLLNPVVSSLQNFKVTWLRYYGGYRPDLGMNLYLTVDPANSKSKNSDYTVMMVIGAHSDGNLYLVDMIRDRLSLTERADKLFKLVKKYKPLCVGYEQYGMQADIQYLREKMDQVSFHFRIIELSGRLSKIERISKLVPDFEYQKIYLPYTLPYIDYQGNQVDLTKSFVEDEYCKFPTSKHDDMLDCLARIKEMPVDYPDDNNWYKGSEDLDFTERDSVTGY